MKPKHLTFLLSLGFAVLSPAILTSCGGESSKETPHVNVSSVSISKASAELSVGQTLQLSATVSPSNATSKTVAWSSSNAGIASVSNTGLVTALKEGTATITASAGGKSATCQVTVTKAAVEVSSVSVDVSSVTLTPGETLTVKVTVNPSDATDQDIAFTSSDESVATVSKDGTVTAVGVGTATITVTAGGKSTTFTVTVNPIEVTSITLGLTSVTIIKGQSATLTATLSPDNATDKTVTWTSSDESVATVSSGGVVNALSVGTAVITATSGNVSARCTVTVIPVPVESVTIDKTSATISIGETIQLSATISPSDAAVQTVTWSSSDTSIASVSSNGIVKGLKSGSVTITASADGKSATCSVTVSNLRTGGNHEGTDDESWE